jgi:hypothetical protein
VIPIANPTRRWQGEHAFINGRSALLFATWTTDRRIGFVYRGSSRRLIQNDRQSIMEGRFYTFSVGCGQTVLLAENPMSPIGGFFR